jgi:type I pantothenate kinase
MAMALADLRQGQATFPAYSHETYDVDPALARTIPRPDIFILEGLGFSAPGRPGRSHGEPDILIYLDASLEDLENWFLERFLRFWNAARTDASSFYAQFLHMTEPELVSFARSVWQGINLPNLTGHILPLRDSADIVVSKDSAHAIRITEDRTG